MQKQYIPALKYHFLTPIYDVIIKLLVPENKIKTEAIEFANIHKKSRIMDFGSGTGTLLLKLKKINNNCFGLEIDPEMRRITNLKFKKQNQKIEIFKTTEKIEKESINVAFSTWVFHHFSQTDKNKYIKELHRILTKEGEIILVDWWIPNNFWMKILFTILQLLDNFETTQDHKTGEFINYFYRNGFTKIIKLKEYNTLLGTAATWKILKH